MARPPNHYYDSVFKTAKKQSSTFIAHNNKERKQIKKNISEINRRQQRHLNGYSKSAGEE